MPRDKFTDDELEMLTEEERAGLEDDDEDQDDDSDTGADNDDDDAGEADDDAADKGDDDDAGADENGKDKKQDDAGDDDDDGGSDDKNEDDDAGDKDGDADADKTGDDDAGDDHGDGEGDDNDEGDGDDQRPAQRSRQEPADAKERLDEIDKSLDDLAEKFDEGELTAKEYRQQCKPFEKERDDLNYAVRSAKSRMEDAADVWVNRTVPRFLKDHPEYKAGTLRHQMLDDLVRRMQVESDNPTDPAILEKAHDKIAAEFGDKSGKKADDTRDGKNNKKNGRKRDDPPPTLADVPADDVTETDDGGKYAYLDRLKGVEFEDALAKLSEEEQDNYLSSR